jgi:hypothetical protein
VRCEVSLQKFGIVFPERATPNVAWVVDVGLLAITTRLNPVGCEGRSGQAGTGKMNLHCESPAGRQTEEN